jgi:hypothetical protein
MTGPTIVEFTKILHTTDALVGKDGKAISDINPPSYKAGELDEIKEVWTQFCCSAMSDHYNKGIIGFGIRPENTYHNTTAEVFIRVQQGQENDIALPYCPWCCMPVMITEYSGEAHD